MGEYKSLKFGTLFVDGNGGIFNMHFEAPDDHN
jgi:hypothetical protein